MPHSAECHSAATGGPAPFLASGRLTARTTLEDDPVALQRLEYLTWTYDHFFRAYGQ